jgi:DNA gyrase subunit B
LNIERARLDRMLASEQIKNLVVALGTAIGDTFDIANLRYHKIILATDADVDGAHIRTLLLTLLYRYFKPLLDNGHVYIAQPPLYKIKRGKEIFYAYNDAEKNEFLGEDINVEDLIEGDEGVTEELSEEGPEVSTSANSEKAPNAKARQQKISIQRYKGLGEMNSDELWETTMDPARRVLKQVAIDDAAEADKVFDILMGTDVPARKSFIQSNAQKATIDI